MKQIYVKAEHWLNGKQEKMFPLDEKRDFHKYVNWLLEHEYMIWCIRVLEV